MLKKRVILIRRSFTFTHKDVNNNECTFLVEFSNYMNEWRIKDLMLEKYVAVYQELEHSCTVNRAKIVLQCYLADTVVFGIRKL